MRCAQARAAPWRSCGTLPGAAPQPGGVHAVPLGDEHPLALILGFVGAGGLGQLPYVELSLFHHAQAGAVILAMLALSVAVDWASLALRR